MSIIKQAKAPTGLGLDLSFSAHCAAPGNLERPSRLEAIENALRADGLCEECFRFPFQAADLRHVLTNHHQDLVEAVRTPSGGGEPWLVGSEASAGSESFGVALRASGMVLHAVDAVMQGKMRNAFCAVRPPGHHAEYNEAMGFCLFNHVAIAARYLRQEHKLDRVLILDWDAHHGNGTQHSFEWDPKVFFCSIHGDPVWQYPNTSGFAQERGKGDGEGFTLNLPMPKKASDAEYRRAFEEQFLPAAFAFSPQFVLVSAGFDAHQNDPIGGLQLKADSFEWLTRLTMELAEKCCQGRLVSVLEGGYDLDALGACAAKHVAALTSA